MVTKLEKLLVTMVSHFETALWDDYQSQYQQGDMWNPPLLE